MAYCCNKCNESFPRKTMLDRHECNSEEPSRPHACEDCGECFTDAVDLSKHECKTKNDDAEEKSTLMKCTYCKARFTNENTLRVHERVHTGDLPYKCQQCGAKFPYHSNLRSHLRIHNDPVDRPHKCDECGAKFTLFTNLEAHLRTHGPDRTSTCPKCFGIIPENCNHFCKQETGESFYVCKECNARFTVKNTLEVHMRTHTGEKPYRCTHCGERFSQTGALHSHIRSHTARLTHECGECSQRFRTEDELREHVRTHDQFILHKCKICFGAFANEKRLLLHMRQKHAQDEDMLQCDRCSRSFSTGSELQTHIREMHSEADSTHSQESDPESSKFRCSKCADCFVSLSFLQSHQRSKHPHASSSYLNSDHRCEDCGSKFTTSNRLIAHRRTKHPDKVRTQRRVEPSATITSPQDETLPPVDAAIKSDQKMTGLPCPSEMESKRKDIASDDAWAMSSEDKLKKPKLSNEEIPFKGCNETSDNQYHLNNHKRAHKFETSCSKCGGCTSKLDNSQSGKHGRRPSRYKCRHCKRKFVGRRHLKAHKCKRLGHNKSLRKSIHCPCISAASIPSSSGKPIHKCPVCRIKLSRKRLVKLHLDSVHKMASRECSACTKIVALPLKEENCDSKDEVFVCSSCNDSGEDEMEVDSTTNNDFEEESSSDGSDVQEVPNVNSGESNGEMETQSAETVEKMADCGDKTMQLIENIDVKSKKKRVVSSKNNQSMKTNVAVGKNGVHHSEYDENIRTITVTSQPLGKVNDVKDAVENSLNAESDSDITEVEVLVVDKANEETESKVTLLRKGTTQKELQEKKMVTYTRVTPTESSLMELVPKLITVLVGNKRLEDFGWPDVSVVQLLERVIRHCGGEPASSNGTTENRLSDNCKVLFEASIGKEETSSLLEEKSVEEVVVEVITLSERDSIDEA